MTLPFHGHPDWQTSLNTADLFSIGTTQVIVGGNDLPFAVFDFRAYSSFYLDIEVQTVNPATAFCPITIGALWTADVTGLVPIYKDVYKIFADSHLSVGFPNLFGRLVLQDAAHGPYLYIGATNNGADNVNFTANVLGNSRTLGRRYVQNLVLSGGTASQADQGQLLSLNTALGAGATSTTIIPMAAGPIAMRQQAVASPMIMQLIAPDGTSVQGWNIAAGVESHSVSYLPRMACKAVVVNSGGVGGTAVWEMTSGRDNW